VDVAVDQVLAERERLARSAPAAASLIAAALLHAVVAALVVLLPRLAPAPRPLEYVAVQLVPAQRLGAQQPAPQPPREARRPEVPPPPQAEEPPAPQAPVLPRRAPPPKPPKPEKPKPAPADTRIDPTTRPKVLPPPREVLQKKLGPAAAAPPQPALPGAAKGSDAGKATVGALTVRPENQDFPYNYYFAQIQSRIEEAWTRSPVGNEARAVISFTIHGDGSISDLRVRESSGFDTFDLAALRAVQNAAPFAPLPRAYTLNHSSLDVNWIAR